jgi:hypothetical protein
MHRLLFLAATFAFFGIGAVDARPLYWPQSTLLMPAASGCGLGVHRNRFSRCYPVHYYLPGYWRGAHAPLCGSRNSRLLQTRDVYWRWRSLPLRKQVRLEHYRRGLLVKPKTCATLGEKRILVDE